MMNSFLICLFSFLPMTNTGVLVVKVVNVQDNRGAIRMAVYDNEALFPSEHQSSRGGVLSPKHGVESAFYIETLPYGKYAVAVYHDINNNGKMDKNKLGIPIEPYAFSNNPKVKWRSPRFQETAFYFGAGRQEITVTLLRWSQH